MQFPEPSRSIRLLTGYRSTLHRPVSKGWVPQSDKCLIHRAVFDRSHCVPKDVVWYITGDFQRRPSRSSLPDGRRCGEQNDNSEATVFRAPVGPDGPKCRDASAPRTVFPVPPFTHSSYGCERFLLRTCPLQSVRVLECLTFQRGQRERHQNNHDRRHRENCRDTPKSLAKFPSGRAHASDPVRSETATEVTQRIDDCDSHCRCGAREPTVGHRPESTRHRLHSGHSERKGTEKSDGAVAITRNKHGAC